MRHMDACVVATAHNRASFLHSPKYFLSTSEDSIVVAVHGGWGAWTARMNTCPGCSARGLGCSARVKALSLLQCTGAGVRGWAGPRAQSRAAWTERRSVAGCVTTRRPLTGGAAAAARGSSLSPATLTTALVHPPLIKIFFLCKLRIFTAIYLHYMDP